MARTKPGPTPVLGEDGGLQRKGIADRAGDEGRVDVLGGELAVIPVLNWRLKFAELTLVGTPVATVEV